MAARTAGKRGNGEGGIYRRESDGRWVASVDLGYINGKRRRKVIYGATRREVAEKLRRALEAKSSGMLVSRTSTLVEWYATYLEQVARAKVRPSTFISYERDFRLHV